MEEEINLSARLKSALERSLKGGWKLVVNKAVALTALMSGKRHPDKGVAGAGRPSSLLV